MKKVLRITNPNDYAAYVNAPARGASVTGRGAALGGTSDCHSERKRRIYLLSGDHTGPSSWQGVSIYGRFQPYRSMQDAGYRHRTESALLFLHKAFGGSSHVSRITAHLRGLGKRIGV